MSQPPKNKAVPSSRIARLSRIGSLATKIAGSVVAQGTTKLLSGQRPVLSDMLLTPKNMQRITNQLASLRGAAMKLGQLISMDAGELLSPQLSAILARLREDADPMPKAQLQGVLDSALGTGWQDRLLYFSYAPIAAASIGQVHKAITMDGETLALKVQYPGIRDSINSDVDNVASIIKLSGMLPAALDIKPLLAEAKQQLHDEADYRREGRMMSRYGAALGDYPALVVPALHSALSTDTVLAMTHLNSEPIESLSEAPADVRNQLMTDMFRLFFDEVFDFRLIQSDPNMANFRYMPDTQQIALLDFGACREVPAPIADGYLALLRAMASDDMTGVARAAQDIGLMLDTHTDDQQAAVLAMGKLACEALYTDGPYDFGNSDLLTRVQAAGMSLSFDQDFWHVPPADAIFIHRKLGGLYFLAKRLNVQVDLRIAAQRWLG
ncbi:AarF/UbiB family protein [Alteromonas gilva]|uniref:AarF/UbiB family protein n=1 Tax=Alteromonas gilva TaxID=2987522 RepID=A0ABT5KWS2_9ALTE|nr:AarF/UbiB family protein [Alteromonas gilva]MDC8829219.1 AarF/UbiB family protein [Alteromonas gilva]